MCQISPTSTMYTPPIDFRERLIVHRQTGCQYFHHTEALTCWEQQAPYLCACYETQPDPPHVLLRTHGALVSPHLLGLLTASDVVNENSTSGGAWGWVVPPLACLRYLHPCDLRACCVMWRLTTNKPFLNMVYPGLTNARLEASPDKFCAVGSSTTTTSLPRV